MVSTKLYGRTGNQMFQIACTIGYAKKHGLEYHIPPITINQKIWPAAFMHLYNRNYKPNKPVVKIVEEGHSYQKLPFKEEWRNLNIELSGYWQSEKYFQHCREDVLNAFKIPWEPLRNAVSVHIRLGDYSQMADKHPIVTDEYLDAAIKYVRGETAIHNFIIFSDDIERAKRMIDYRLHYGCSFEYSKGGKPLDDLSLMSSCAHNICANSSFSWWGNWLNQNPNKISIYPKVWFGPGNSSLETKDIYPQNAIIV